VNQAKKPLRSADRMPLALKLMTRIGGVALIRQAEGTV
jgi:hypothetical protein